MLLSETHAPMSRPVKVDLAWMPIESPEPLSTKTETWYPACNNTRSGYEIRSETGCSSNTGKENYNHFFTELNCIISKRANVIDLKHNTNTNLQLQSLKKCRKDGGGGVDDIW